MEMPVAIPFVQLLNYIPFHVSKIYNFLLKAYCCVSAVHSIAMILNPEVFYKDLCSLLFLIIIIHSWEKGEPETVEFSSNRNYELQLNYLAIRYILLGYINCRGYSRETENILFYSVHRKN